MSKKLFISFGFILIMILATAGSVMAVSFTDTSGNPHEDAILEMARLGILEGVGDNRYAPGDPLQMVHWTTILIRILEHDNPGMSWPNDYDDVANMLGIDRGLYKFVAAIMII